MAACQDVPRTPALETQASGHHIQASGRGTEQRSEAESTAKRIELTMFNSSLPVDVVKWREG